MILVKIGSDSSCDIVLHSEYVSALHAELLIDNNGVVTIEDKGSRNGTVVGQKRLEPGHKVKVNRGEQVLFANAALDWSMVPTPSQKSNTVACYEIGKDTAADIKLSSGYASRFHATLKVTKDNKVFIEDNGSKNGTRVNGSKIARHQMVRIKKGDQIVCGDEDISEAVGHYLKDTGKRWMVVGVGAAAAVVAVLAILYASGIMDFGKKETDPNVFRTTVVYVRPHYHYVAHFEDNPIPENIWNGDIDMKELTGEIAGEQATAFFVDSVGRMATSRCVAVPWEYASNEEVAAERAKIERFWNSLIGADPAVLAKKKLSKLLLQHAAKAVMLSQRKDKSKDDILLEFLHKLLSSKITLKGKLDDVLVGYSGNKYSDVREFDHCKVLAESGSKDKDFALLQMNNQTTPSAVKCCLSLYNTADEKAVTTGELFVAGYANDNVWDAAKGVLSIESKLSEVKCVSASDDANISLDKEAVSDACGAPVFDKYGRIAGIVCSNKAGAATSETAACKAKNVKQLYLKVIKQNK